LECIRTGLKSCPDLQFLVELSGLEPLTSCMPCTLPWVHCPASTSRRPPASADLALAPACGVCDRSGHRACSRAVVGTGPCPACTAPARAWSAIQAWPLGLYAGQPRPLRRSKDGQTIFPIPAAQGPKTTLSRRSSIARKNLNQCPYLHLAESHREQPGVLPSARSHRGTCRGTEPGGLAARARLVAPLRPNLSN